ncbi:MAG: NADH-quinone oxidoreductase subunit N [Bacteroidota bacterium]
MNTLIIISLLGVTAMMADALRFKKILLPLIVAGLLAGLGFAVSAWNTDLSYYHEMVHFNNYSLAFSSLMIIVTLLWLFISKDYFTSLTNMAEHAALILFVLTGAIIMTAFSDLSMFFVGLEILSISLYVLAASNKSELRSNEAGMKYFLMGSFATGFLLFGIALIYGATATFNLAKIASVISTSEAAGNTPMFVYAGVLLIMVGLLFKVSAAPFHFWAPDVYEGAPTVITAFMATVVKTAAFAAFYRLFSICFHDLTGFWAHTMAIVSAVTMIGGNILAVYQKSLKRMMAYSSIAHAGYMLMAIVAMNKISPNAIFLYTAAYSVASMGMFALMQAMTHAGDESLDSLKGLAKNNKGVIVFLSALVFSMAGIPPMAGFFAKYYIFLGAIQSGYTWLTLVAVLSSLIGVYYYFKVIFTSLQDNGEASSITLNAGQLTLIVLGAIISLAIGIMPGILSTLSL